MHRKLPERLALYGVLELVFNNKQIWAATGWRARCQSCQTSFRGRGLSCPSQNRLTSDALLSHWQGPRGWADWSPAITDMEYWYILPGSSFHSKEAPFLPSSHVRDPSLVPSQPRPGRPCTRGRTSPGRDALSRRRRRNPPGCFSLQLALRRVLLQTSQGFYSTNNCMRGTGEAEKDLCVVVL